MEHLDKLPYIYLGMMTLIAYLAMGADKLQAGRGGRRIRERTLFLLALLGGSIGAIAGMYSFRHKTLHWYFRFGLPAVLVLQLALVLGWYYIFVIQKT